MKKLVAISLVIVALMFAPPSGAVPEYGMSGVCPNAAALAQWAAANYPGITSIGGVRQDRLPDHPSGHAIDLMVPDIAYGDMLYAAVMAHWNDFQIKYVLWKVPNHWNHVHVTVF